MLDPVQRYERRRPSPRAQLRVHQLVLAAFALLAVADALRGRWVSAVAHTIVVLLQLAFLSWRRRRASRRLAGILPGQPAGGLTSSHEAQTRRGRP